MFFTASQWHSFRDLITVPACMDQPSMAELRKVQIADFGCRRTERLAVLDADWAGRCHLAGDALDENRALRRLSGATPRRPGSAAPKRRVKGDSTGSGVAGGRA